MSPLATPSRLLAVNWCWCLVRGAVTSLSDSMCMGVTGIADDDEGRGVVALSILTVTVDQGSYLQGMLTPLQALRWPWTQDQLMFPFYTCWASAGLHACIQPAGVSSWGSSVPDTGPRF